MAEISTSTAHQPRLLNLMGYWASSEGDSEDTSWWPDPRDLIGDWNDTDRKLVFTYLSSGIVCRRYMGFASCRICSDLIGSEELTDGVWSWPQKLEHYVKVHRVQLPTDFIETARAAAWRMPDSLREEFAAPELWLDSGKGVMPADPKRCHAVVLKPDAWLDWAAARIPPRPAPDAVTLDEAKVVYARLSHRRWEAFVEERFGRWRIICRAGGDEDLIYVERCPSESLQRRLVAQRVSDPDALLELDQAQAIAKEFDGPWGIARIVAKAEDRWLIWVIPPGVDWPSSADINKAAEGASFGWALISPDGSRAFACPLLDEFQWRMVLGRTRAETRPRRPRPKPPQSHPRTLWERIRSILAD